MTAHTLDLSGDRQSGKTTLALDMLEYANLGNRNVAYIVPTQTHLAHIKATGTSALCLTYFDILEGRHGVLNSKPLDLAVIDLCGSGWDAKAIEVVALLKSKMLKNNFAQIIRIR